MYNNLCYIQGESACLFDRTLNPITFISQCPSRICYSVKMAAVSLYVCKQAPMSV